MSESVETDAMAERRKRLSGAKQALLDRLSKGGMERRQRITRREDPHRAPVSFSQQRLWFLEQLTPGSAIYNMHDAARIQGRMAIEDMRRVLETLVSRHEVLRTTFRVEDGVPVQCVAPDDRPFELPVDDLRNMDPARRWAHARRLATEETQRPFDLEVGPLFRARVIRIDDEDALLIWTMHHAVSDGWSLGVIIREVLALSIAYANGEKNPLPPLALQYGDYAQWQRRWLEDDVMGRQLDYWRKALDGDIPAVSLPTDHPRPAFPSYGGDRVVRVFPTALREGLKQLASRQGATLFMVMLATFDVLLHRYSGMSRIFVGTPVANRNSQELEDLIGFFVNTLVLGADFSEHPTFVQLLAQVRQTALNAYEHQDIPFERLVEELQPHRETNQPPFFQVMLVLQNEPMPAATLPGLTISPYEIHNGTSKFDLLVNVFEEEEGLNVGIEYSTDIFERATVERMLDHYRNLLEAVVQDPECDVERLPMMGHEERIHILEAFNDTARDYSDSRPHLLHALIERQVEKTPDAPAFRFEGREFSYAEMNDRANELAHRLRRMGAGPNEVVGICAERSAELVIGLLGILKAGAAYLPLDAEYPPERLRFMFEESQASIMLHTGSVPPWVDTDRVRCMALSVNGAPDPLLVTNLETANRETDLAYVIYTSGSTGRPKGAANTHRAICNRILWMQEAYRLMPDERVLQKTPFSFDVSVWEFFWPLMSGACLVVAPPGAHRDSSWLARIIQEEHVSVLHFVPSMLGIFLQDPEALKCTGMRAVMCSGEALTPALRDAFLERFDCELHNLYGPSEAAVDVTAWDCRKPYPRPVVPIGTPIANTRMHILDGQMQPVPVGVIGELYIGGTNVGAGYLHRDDLTRERFVDDPFGGEGKLYRTGDLARYDAEGVIEYAGRIDHQVKIRGLRIELAEIEHALVQDASVDSSVVLAREDVPGDPRLTAYVVLENEPVQDRDREDGAVDEWRLVFDDAYTAGSGGEEHGASGHVAPVEDDAAPVAAETDYSGWVSSYSGEEIPRQAMKEWVDVTIDRLIELQPRRVLEIGCGTGLLLFRLLDHVERYVGTDISRTAVRNVRAALDARGVDSTVAAVHEQAAHEVDLLKEGDFDLIVMNSVVQYFPDVDYLLAVLGKCRAKLAPGGRVFLGDLRNSMLMDTFAASVEAFRAHDDDSVSVIRERVGRNLEQERELAIDPRLMDWICRSEGLFSGAHVWLRRGRHDTEMCRYRYDAVLETAEMPAVPAPRTVDWNGQDGLDALKALAQARPEHEALLVRGIPNARLFHDACVRQAMGDLEETPDVQPDTEPDRQVLMQRAAALQEILGQALDPEAVCVAVAGFGQPLVGWTAASASATGEGADDAPGGAGFGAFDLLLAPASWPVMAAASALPCPPAALSARPVRYASQPGRKAREIALRARLQERLLQTVPEYMIPSAWVFLDEWPLLANGKIDRRALPPPGQQTQNRASRHQPPRTPLEEALAEVWASVLNLSRVGIDEDFFSLGGHSLLAAQLVLKLRERLGREVPLRYLFLSPTIEGMATLIEQGGEETADSETLWARMQRDAVLPASIMAPGKPVPMQEARQVLLTGATGFLGVFVLRELLRRTRARVLCLVRAQDAAGGWQRIEETLARYGLSADVDLARIEVLVGDLSSTALGLDVQTHQDLAERLDAIYHCAAQVNFVSSYDRLVPANVDGTRALIELACAHRTKHFHLVSTIFTLTAQDAGTQDMGRVCELDAARHGDRLQMGYLQSKWVAERMAEAARDRGLPVSIHRPGRIAGDSGTGACQQDDFYWSLVRVCLMLRGMPVQGFDEILTPVDRVAAAIVELSQDETGLQQAWHPIAGDMVTQAILVDALQRAGHELDIISYDEWRDRALQFLEKAPHDPAARLAGFLFNGDEGMVEEPEIDSTATRQSAMVRGVDLVSMSGEMLDRQIAYFQSTGFFPAPRHEHVA